MSEIEEAFKREIERLIEVEKESYEEEENETGKAHIWFTIQALEAALNRYSDHELVQGCTASLAGQDHSANTSRPENSHAGVYDTGELDQQFEVFWEGGWYWAALHSGRRGGPFGTSRLAADDAGYELRMYR